MERDGSVPLKYKIIKFTNTFPVFFKKICFEIFLILLYRFFGGYSIVRWNERSNSLYLFPSSAVLDDFLRHCHSRSENLTRLLGFLSFLVYLFSSFLRLSLCRLSTFLEIFSPGLPGWRQFVCTDENLCVHNNSNI